MANTCRIMPEKHRAGGEAGPALQWRVAAAHPSPRGIDNLRLFLSHLQHVVTKGTMVHSAIYLLHCFRGGQSSLQSATDPAMTERGARAGGIP